MPDPCDQCGRAAVRAVPDLVEIAYEHGYHRFVAGTVRRGCFDHLPRKVMYFLDGRRLDLGTA
jgi:hypothetical protein